jgi:hypothetical protein
MRLRIKFGEEYNCVSIRSETVNNPTSLKNVDHRTYLRGRKWQEAEEDCIMRSFITCTLHQILLG